MSTFTDFKTNNDIQSKFVRIKGLEKIIKEISFVL